MEEESKKDYMKETDLMAEQIRTQKKKARPRSFGPGRRR
jgi:hypothetical protein